MNDASILLVDDEQAILDMLETVLQKEGFTTISKVTSAEEALTACTNSRIDIIVLDVMLPGRSGIDVAPFLRQLTNAPILFLTARTSDFDKLTGFAVGGDDYITKPFNPLEVVARIRSQLRRYLSAQRGQHVVSHSVEESNSQSSKIYDYGRFQVNEEACELQVDGQAVTCPALVFQLLLFLCKHPNRIFGKGELYESVWGIDALKDDNTVMVHIHRIRERIEVDPSNPQFIINVRGLGYKLVQKNNKGIDAL
ncbi:response regulator transcription factor [Paenibacillus sp. L3-i20]|uniref:response regulator transcription factor n=1 Tax=Paenibacillus sp. L3-i20 TaxID=2905833 RepID=UPI001EDF356A|nr:response regulator transcription factor [Paenibacillus sp. L3-i20]GKU76184.1 DNA-binding response regulator [Paenibacillus sp. L3-i20]